MSRTRKEIIRNISVDCAILGCAKSTLEVLLIRRPTRPCKGMWALPGGFVRQRERTEAAAGRILKHTTGLSEIYLEEIGVFDEIDRYPARRVLTVAFIAFVSPEHYGLTVNPGMGEARWFPLEKLPSLPFDHSAILTTAVQKLRKRIRLQPIGFETFPERFTLPQLQRLYEVILGKVVDKRNFRKKILAMHFVTRLNQLDRNGRRRPATFYKFDRNKYNELKEKGVVFEL